MNYKSFKALVEINTQDAQSKLPTSFNQWKMIIELGIKKLEDETELELKTSGTFDSDNDDIPVIENIVMALVYHISQMFVIDINLKQKLILDYEDAKGTFLWNKFKETEMAK